MPTVTLEAVKDAVMAKALNGTFSGWNGKDNHIQVGATANRKWRGVIKFNLGDTSNWSGVSSAILTLTCFSDETNHESGTGNTMELKYARMTSDWGEGSIDPGEGDASGAMDWHWDNRYDKWTNDSRQTMIQGSTGVTRTLDLTSIVNDWVVDGKTNYGIILMNGTSENDVNKAFLFYSMNTGSAGNRPQLDIVYTVNTAPSASTGLTPTGNTVVNSLTPSFSFSLSDIDANDYLTGCWIQVVDDTETTKYWDSGKIGIAAGYPTSMSITYGTGTDNGQGVIPLVAGSYYKWRVIAYDRAEAPSPWTAYQRFFVNAIPSTPTVTVSPAPLSAVPDDTPNVSVTHNDPSPSDSLMHGYRVVVEAESFAGAGDWDIVWDSDNVDTSGAPVSTSIVTTGTLAWGSSCRVKARTQDSYGAWSSYSPWLAFSIIATGAPTNLNPANSEVVSATPTLSGARASSSDTITAFWLRVFSDDLQTTMLAATRYTTGILTGSTFSKLYAGSALTAGQSYQWQAMIESASGGSSPWSTLQRFTVAAATVPDAVSPVGDNSYSLTPTISWTRASVFNRIQFEIYPESSTSSVLGTAHYASGTVSTGITGAGPTTYSATYAGTALVYDTGYKMRARVSSDGGSNWSGWSGLAWFKTSSASAPTLTSVAGDAANPAWITDATPDFIITRGGTDTIDKVRIRVFDSSNVAIWDSGLVDVANATTGTVTYAGPALVPGYTYIWDANYQSTVGPVGPYAASKQFRLNGPPYIPSELIPSNAYVYRDTETKTFGALFSDPDVSGFADYPNGWEIVVENIDESPFNTQTITSNLVNGLNTITWPGTAFVTGNEYRWRTRFRDSKNEWGSYSAWQSFKIAAPPNGTISTPSNGSTVTTVTPTITWSYSGGTQQYYTIDIKQTDSGGAIIKNITALGPYFGTETSKAIPAGYLNTNKYYNLTLTVTSTDNLTDPSPSTVNVLVQTDAPNPIVGVDTVANESLSSVTLSWTETTLKANHTFIAYRIYRRRPSLTDWELAGEVSKKSTTTFTDWYAGNTVTYQYVVRGVTHKSDAGVELESPDDSSGGSFGETAVNNDNWTFVGADRSPEHINNLAVTDESHNRPIQQEVFETLGSSRKVIMRGFVLGHEGSITTLWLNAEVTLPEDGQILTTDTVVGRRLVNYLTYHAGPHILKSPFGDVWDAQFTSPEYRWIQTGHLEVTLNYVETGTTSMGEI
jgi:hypothetical protein